MRFTNVDLLSNLVPRTPAWRRHVPPALYVLALAALVIGLARPSAMLAVPREDATIVLTMDVSGSMLATDVAPSRLDSAKQAASAFIDQLPASFRVGLVTFGTAAQVAVSPTTDRAEVHAALDALQAEGGTALGDAIGLSLGMAQDVIDAAANSAADLGASSPSPSSVAVGRLLARPVGAGRCVQSRRWSRPCSCPTVRTRRASSNRLRRHAPLRPPGCPIYTIALGTATGVVSVTDEFGVPHTVEVPPDTDTLAAIAETTGARSFEAPTADDLQQIYESLGSRVGVRYEAQEITQLFAAAGLVLMVAGAGLAAHWFNRFP